ncbi:MAG: hypothetical protein MUP85_04840 [Candidatus Lokiarchaeota archaeon]|nr:hypothetical protein [Candidatus Lokiarchaeota archaeon]
MDLELIKIHLKDARIKSRNSFEEYDSLWLAFNVMYEGTRPELINRNRRSPITEREMIRHCSKKLNYEEWSQLFEAGKLDSLFSIAPIFNERDWQRKAKINNREFKSLLETTKRALTGRADEDASSLEALVDLLYIVRCNRCHGFKTPDRPRDREVLDATVPLLRELVTQLATHFSVI